MVRRTTKQSWHGFVSGQRVRMLIETRGATADDREIAHPSGTLATISGLANFGDFQGEGVRFGNWRWRPRNLQFFR